jgi:hypothetical protein
MLTPEQIERLRRAGYSDLKIGAFEKRQDLIQPRTDTQPEGPSFLGEAGQDIAQTASGIGDVGRDTGRKIQESVSSDAPFQVKLGQVSGAVAGGISGTIGEVLKGGAKLALTRGGEERAKGAIGAVTEPIVQSKPVQGLIEYYQSLSDNDRRTVDASLGGAGLALDVALLGGGKKAGEVAIKEGSKLGSKALDVGEAGIKRAGRAVEPAVNLAERGAGVVTRAVERGRTNIRAASELDDAVRAIPTGAAQNLARTGVGLNDTRTILRIVPEAKEASSRLFQAVKSFTANKTGTNPTEIIGEPLVKSLDRLQGAREKLGSQIGEVAKTLDNVPKGQVAERITARLQRVPGMEGITITPKGKLEFKGTVFETLAAKEQKALQQAFDAANSGGTGYQKHLLRQRLFETTRAAKRSGTPPTDTFTSAIDAIRGGLLDILSQNNRYAALSQEFAKVMGPLADLEKLMKSNKMINASEDIIKLKAGLLARRLSSNAASNPEIRAIIQRIDGLMQTNSLSQVEGLQALYNIFNKHYDIAGDTTFQGLTQTARGVGETVIATGKKVVGETPAVRQKAIEDLMRELLKKG